MKELGIQWKNLKHGEKEKYLQMAKSSKDEYYSRKENSNKKEKVQNHNMVYLFLSVIFFLYKCLILQLGTRCSPGMIVKLIQKLSEAQKKAIQDIGFGGLLGLKCKVLRRDLCAWLVDQFDPISCVLNIHGKSLKLSPKDVEHILGLRYGGIDVETSGPAQKINGLCKSMFSGMKDISLKYLNEKLQEMKEDSDDFLRVFVLFSLGCLLCPSTKNSINSSFLYSVVEVGSLGEKNWAKLVFDALLEGVQRYKTNEQNNISGCLLILKVMK